MKSSILIWLLVIGCSGGVAQGCDCDRLTPAEAATKADIVFSGRLTKVTAGTRADPGRAFFKVERVWKGSVGIEVEVAAIKADTDCLGFQQAMMMPGSELLVYAVRSPFGDPPKMRFATFACGRTNFLRLARGDVASLGAGQKPRSSRSPH